MATMKGILLNKAGSPFTVADNLDKPKPCKRQILIKSLVTAINPVEGFMQSTGQLVTAWPIVLGCDASGVVVEVGEDVRKFKEGDLVFGCTRLGVPGHSTFQEYFLMDEVRTFKKPTTISTEQAATIGVGLLTACLGLISGAMIELVEREESNEWVIILGAAGSVGQYAVQVAKLCGYKVLASCSPKNDEFVKGLGANATIDYKLPIQTQLQQIEHITGRKFSRVFDASAMATETGMEALAKYGDPAAKTKYFSTTNDWMPIDPKQGVEIYMVTLGIIGRTGDAHKAEVNAHIEALIPKLEKYLEERKLKSMEYESVGDVSVEGILTAIDAFNGKKSSEKKILARLAADCVSPLVAT